MVISFSGSMGSGKDTFGNITKKILEKDFLKKVDLTSFAEELKKEVNRLLNLIKYEPDFLEVSKQIGLFEYDSKEAVEIISKVYGISVSLPIDVDVTKTKNQKTRQLLQFWGTDVRRKKNDKYWIEKTIQRVKENEKNNIVTIVTDGRFLNEIEALREFDDSVIIKLETSLKNRLDRIKLRDNFIPDEKSLNHSSESGFNKFDNYDLVICNDNCDLKDLEKEVKSKIIPLVNKKGVCNES